MWQKKYFLKLKFSVLRTIHNLPFFHNAQWSALFRFAYNSYLEENENMSELGISVNPADTGIMSYSPGDSIEVGVSLDVKEFKRFKEVLYNLDKAQGVYGHFVPENTVRLETATCRISGKDIKKHKPEYLKKQHVKNMIAALKALPEFDILFVTPLRYKRPPDDKVKGHKYLDNDLLVKSPELFGYFMKEFSEKESEISALKIKNGNFLWLDMKYGKNPNEKSFGGIIGGMKITKKKNPSVTFWESFILKSYTGIGKNRTFGFGIYVIPQIRMYDPLIPLVRHHSLLKDSVSVISLQHQLNSVKDNENTESEFTVKQLKKAGASALKNISDSVLSGKYTPVKPVVHEIKKKNGSSRTIYIPSVTDRILMKSLSSGLSVLNEFISEESHAYKKQSGVFSAIEAYRNAVSSGFIYGVKTDISSFFDSVPLDRLFNMLDALFFNEPAIKLIKSLYNYPSVRKGLLQGYPLSPLLANLYLSPFDEIMKGSGVKLIRYSDDMLVLFKHKNYKRSVMRLIHKTLAERGLLIEASKTEYIEPDKQFVFLGHILKNGNIIVNNEPPAASDETTEISETTASADREHWNKMFGSPWRDGKVVYITSEIHKVYTAGEKFGVKKRDGKSLSYPWKKIKHIVVVGRQRLTGAVFAKAAEMKVPITFQYLNGGINAQFIMTDKVYSSNYAVLQAKRFADPDYALAWAKKLAVAKIKNRAVALYKRKGSDMSYVAKATERIKRCNSADELRGVEGYYSGKYYAEFAKFTGNFEFKGRIYHPPDGPVNAMLSLGYTLLYHRLNAALLRAGLDTRTGFFHVPHGKHAVLTSDMLEEIRYISDRVVLSLINLNIINETHFVPAKDGEPAVYLKGEGFKRFIRRFEKTMSSEFISSVSHMRITKNEYLDEMAERAAVCLHMGIVYEPAIIF